MIFISLSIKIKDSTIAYGAFIQAIVDFLIIASCIFIMVKIISRFQRKVEKEEKKEEPKKSDEVVLLEEIRDLLKKKTK